MDHVWRHSQRHVTPPHGPLDEGADTVSALDRSFWKPNWLSCSPRARRDKCDSSRAATTLSNSLPAWSNRHTGRRAEGESGERPGFGNRTTRPTFHRTGNSPRDRHLSNRVLSLGVKTPATSFHKRAGTPSGPGAFHASIFSTASASSSSVIADSGLQIPALSRGSYPGSCSSRSSFVLPSSSFTAPGNRAPTTSSRN
jgi:hypothetical protein